MSQGCCPAPAGKPATGVDWSRFARLLEGKRRVVLTTHVRPDCDALGSELGMAGVLEALGKEVLIANAFEVPKRLMFLDPSRKLKRLGVDVTAAEIEQFELLIVLDTSAWNQLGEMGEVVRNTAIAKAVVDHHVSGDDLGAEVFKDSSAEAAGRLVVEAADCLGVALTPEIAHPLFAALATDTGWFRFSSTTEATYRLAARLTAAGVRPDQLYRDLYENDTLSRLKLTGRAIGRTEIELDGRLVHTYISLDDLRAVEAQPGDTEDIINATLHVGGTQVAVVFMEQPSGEFRVSFRSRDAVDCSRVAATFGGGGHTRAAGATVAGPLERARTEVLDAVRRAMR